MYQSLLCLALVSAASCVPYSEPLDGGPADDAGTTDQGADGGARTDAGPEIDAGPPEIDGGPAEVDAGPAEVDAGPAEVDAGPPEVDAGPPEVDAGPPEVDAGPDDEDAGLDDAGLDDAGQPSLPSHVVVDASAPASGDGREWATAFKHLQDALLCVRAGDDGACAGVTEIWVAAGVYYPDDSESGAVVSDDPLARFDAIPGVALYGGFAGTEAERFERDPEANVTVLSGDLQQDDDAAHIDTDGVLTSTDGIVGTNSNVLVALVTDEATVFTADTVVDGFTLTANAAPGYDSAMLCFGMYTVDPIVMASPTLGSLRFIGNWSEDGPGGMYLQDADVALADSSFRKNRGRAGGGMYVEWSRVQLSNVEFIENVALYRYGGGIRLIQYEAVLSGVTMVGNEAYEGGGINALSGGTYLDGSLVITSSHFEGNVARGGGGALRMSGGTLVLSASQVTSNVAHTQGGGVLLGGGGPARIEGTAFEGNAVYVTPTIGTSRQGGGLWTVLRNVSLTDTTFTNNSVEDGTGGGAHIHQPSGANLARVTFTGNSAAKSGGGLQFVGLRAETLTLGSVAFTDNTAGTMGGGLHLYGGGVTRIANVLFAGNAADRGGGAAFTGGATTQVFTATFSTNSAVTEGSSVLVGGSNTTVGLIGSVVEAGGSLGHIVNGGTLDVSSSLLDVGEAAITGAGAVTFGGGSDFSTGGGNITGTPVFEDAAAGDFTLAAGSPGLDSGDNAALPADWLDLDGDDDVTEALPHDRGGNDRICNTTADMGALERCP